MSRQDTLRVFHGLASLGFLYAALRLFVIATFALLAGDDGALYQAFIGTWVLRIVQVGLACWVEWAGR